MCYSIICILSNSQAAFDSWFNIVLFEEFYFDDRYELKVIFTEQEDHVLNGLFQLLKVSSSIFFYLIIDWFPG